MSADGRPEPRICPACGSPRSGSARFCTRCGAELPEEPHRESAARPEVPWRGWEALVVWLLAFATAAVVSFIASLGLKRDGATAFTLVAIQLSLAIWVIGWVRLRHGRGVDALGWHPSAPKRDVGWGLLSGLLGLALQVWVLLPLTFFLSRLILGRTVKVPEQIAFDRPGTALIVVTGITVVVLAPIAEELFFRGFLYQALRRRWGIGIGAAASAGFFALAHISPVFYLPIGVLGYILAKAFERRGSLLTNIVGHAFFNAVGFTVIVFTWT